MRYSAWPSTFVRLFFLVSRDRKGVGEGPHIPWERFLNLGIKLRNIEIVFMNINVAYYLC